MADETVDARRVRQVGSPVASLRAALELEWIVVAAVTPLLLFPSLRPCWTALALVTLALLWLLRWLVRGEPWPVTAFNVPLLAFMLTIPVALWVSPLPEFSVPKAAGLVLGLATFRATAFAMRGRRALGLAVAVFCGLGLAILGIGTLSAQWLEKVTFLTALTSRVPRLIASLPGLRAVGVHPNQIAGALTLYLPLAVALPFQALQQRTRAQQWLGTIGAAGFLAAVVGLLVLTQSRSGWIGGVVGVLALVSLSTLAATRRWKQVLGALLPLVAAVAVAAIIVAVGPARVGEVLYGAGTEAPVEEAIGTVSMAGRLEIWSRALYAVQDFPFTGCGLGAFRRVVHVLYPLFIIGIDVDIAHAHNMLLQTALDVGLPGLIAYLALLVVAGATCWHWARRGGGPVRTVALGLGAGLIGLHVYGLTDALALGSKPAVAFWLALGLLAGLEWVADEDPAVAQAETSAARSSSRRSLVLVAATVVVLGVALVLGWRALAGAWDAGPPALRVPLYPAAEGVETAVVDAPPDAGWVGPLETATFSTAHPIGDIAAFYRTALAEAGWTAQVEAGDDAGWGAVYTHDGGRSVCLMTALEVGGDVWVSIVCGDKAAPVDVPYLPSPTPLAEPTGG